MGEITLILKVTNHAIMLSKSAVAGEPKREQNILHCILITKIKKILKP